MTELAAGSLQQADGAEAWIPALEVAALLRIDATTVRRRCLQENWAHQYVSVAETGGRRLEIALSALPSEARERFARGQGLGARGQGSEVSDQRAEVSERKTESPGRDPQTGLTADEMWEDARECDRAVAIAREATLQALDIFLAASTAQRGTRGQTVLNFIQYWNAAHPDGERVSRSTLGRWRKDYRERGRAGLLPGYASGPRGHVLHPEIEELFRQVYLTQQRISVPVARQVVIGLLIQRKSVLAQSVPSAATLRRYIQTLPQAAVILAREGAEAYRRKCAPHVDRDYTQIRVMQCWVSDHRQFDFFCQGLDGKPIRPWVTLWIDMRSRRRVGWVISDCPSQDTVLAALAQGILRYGIPEEAYTDNGRDYSSLTLTGASRRWKLKLDEAHITTLTEHLHLAWHFAIPKAPQGKGVIERALGTDAGRFDRLVPSYCGPDNTEKPDGLRDLLKRPGALPSLQDIHTLYTQYTDTVANALPHEGQGMDGRSPAGVFGAEEYTKRTATRASLRLMFMRAVGRSTTDKHGVRTLGFLVGKNGIHAFGRDFWSEALMLAHGQRVYYRYDLDDISALDVYTLQDQYLCTVHRRELLGATSKDYRRHQHEKKIQRAVARQFQVHQREALTTADKLAAIAAANRQQAAGSGQPAGGPGGPDGGERAARVVQIVPNAFEEAVRMKAAGDTRHAARARILEAVADKNIAESREQRAESREQHPATGSPERRTRRPSRAELSDRLLEERYASRATSHEPRATSASAD